MFISEKMKHNLKQKKPGLQPRLLPYTCGHYSGGHQLKQDRQLPLPIFRRVRHDQDRHQLSASAAVYTVNKSVTCKKSPRVYAETKSDTSKNSPAV